MLPKCNKKTFFIAFRKFNHIIIAGLKMLISGSAFSTFLLSY